MSLARHALAAGLLLCGLAGHAARSATLDPEVPGEILLKLSTGAALPALLSKYQLTLVSQFGARPIYRVKVAGTGDAHARIEAIGLEPDVQVVESNVLHSAPEARKNNAWAIGTPTAYVAQWAPAAIRMAEAQKTTLGAGVRVAVLDTGVDPLHPALVGHLLPGVDFVDGDNAPWEVGTPADGAFGHGTHVAGLVALVAPAAKIMPLRVLTPSGMGDAWSLAAAVLHAVDPDGNPETDDGAHVINLSLGSFSRTKIMDTIAKLASCTAFDTPGANAEVADAGYNDDRARCRRTSGAVVVAAAGNDASDGVKEYPAAEGAYGLIAVTASNAAGRLAAFGNFGSWVNVAAPGDGITSAIPGGLFGTWSGTSMASPFVAGVAALVRAADPALTPDDVARRIERSAGGLCGNPLPHLDAFSAVTGAAAPPRSCSNGN